MAHMYIYGRECAMRQKKEGAWGQYKVQMPATEWTLLKAQGPDDGGSNFKLDWVLSQVDM